MHGLLDGVADLVGEVEQHHRVQQRLGPEWAVSIGGQNSISHFDGSGIAPSGPSAGKVGVTGK